MNDSCAFHRLFAAACISISVTLAFVAISIAVHSTPKNSYLQDGTRTNPFGYELSANVLRTLRRSGFSTMATLLQLSPNDEIFSQNLTIFLIEDSALENTFAPPLLLRSLLQYHIIKFRVSLDDLLKKPQGTCFSTNFRSYDVTVTKVDAKERAVEINNVMLSNADLFLGEKIAIHGVRGPFSPMDHQAVSQGLDFIKSPVCNSAFDVRPSEKIHVEWTKILHLLRNKGFVSFAIGLHSVLDGIFGDQMGLESVTILVPPNLALLASPSPLLNRAVSLHILPQKFTYAQLSSLPTRSLLRTFVLDEYLEINTGTLESDHRLFVNGVEIVEPDMLSSETFVIHGISRALKIG